MKYMLSISSVLKNLGMCPIVFTVFVILYKHPSLKLSAMLIIVHLGQFIPDFFQAYLVNLKGNNSYLLHMMLTYKRKVKFEVKHYTKIYAQEMSYLLL